MNGALASDEFAAIAVCRGMRPALTLCRPNRSTAHWLTYVYQWVLPMVEQPSKHSARPRRSRRAANLRSLRR